MKTIISLLLGIAIVIGAYSQAIAQQSSKSMSDEYILADYNGETNGAISDYNTLIEEGVVKDANEDYKGAIEYFTRAITLNVNNPEAYDRRGISYLKLLKYQRAYKDFEMAIKLDTSNAEAYNHRGIANYCLQQPMNALEDYTKAIEMDEKYAIAYYNRGLVYIAFEEYGLAYNDLKIALGLGYFEAREVMEKYCGNEGRYVAKN